MMTDRVPRKRRREETEPQHAAILLLRPDHLDDVKREQVRQMLAEVLSELDSAVPDEWMGKMFIRKVVI
jgi:hypothetical protein